MKKKLQKEISELAAELRKAGTDFDVAKIKHAVRLIYEKLNVLEYLEGQLEESSDSVDSKSFREQNWFTEPEPVPRPEHKEDIIEPVMEKIKDIVAQMPQESQQIDELLKEVLPEQEYVKNDLEEFASNYQEMPVFERKEKEITIESKKEKAVNDIVEADKPKSINETISKGLNIGLNDRVAFIKALFNGNAEDYSRTLSQINTMQSFDQAETFIKEKVKPDHNYWLDNEDVEERFMAVVEKSFN